MCFRNFMFIGVVVSGLGITLARAQAPAGFTALFNGQNLDGWWGAATEDPRAYMELPEEKLRAKKEASLSDIRQHWRVENQELINDGKGLFLTTDRLFGDFELRLEYRMWPKGDSGVYLRGCPQVQIWDFTEEAKFKLGADKGSGGLWNNRAGAPGKDPLVRADRPLGEWNQLRVVMVGARVWIWLNGQKTVDGAIMDNYFDRKSDAPRPIPARGPIQLQTHGSEIRWRNIFVRDLPTDEANQWLRDRTPAEGFVHVFNGQDLSGWTGALDNYEVVDGAIVCKPKKGGCLFTQEIYTNFFVKMEIRLPPGGNNGLAIRYPGKGNGAYDGMCELQVLDDYASKWAQLDPRQYHGSAYGMVAAHRGYLRPAGTWNYQEVTITGSHVRVELNGTVILDADLSKVTAFMKNTPHPGIALPAGHFGFLGHNDPVAFRAVSIRRLP